MRKSGHGRTCCEGESHIFGTIDEIGIFSIQKRQKLNLCWCDLELCCLDIFFNYPFRCLMLGRRICVSFFCYFDVVVNVAQSDESICPCTQDPIYEFPSCSLDEFSVDYPIVYQKRKYQCHLLNHIILPYVTVVSNCFCTVRHDGFTISF